MEDVRARMPVPRNEPGFAYAPGQPETARLKAALSQQLSAQTEVAPIIDGKPVLTGVTQVMRPPHRTAHSLGVCHLAGTAEVEKAIQGALKVSLDWARTSTTERAAIFLRAADLLSGKYRDTLNAATMLAQSKTCHQAEIDSACELIDFFRFNVYFQQQLHRIQPKSTPEMANTLQYRPLEGFVFAVTPFNFTAIAGNLPTSAALMGNVVLWKPASSAVYSGHFIMKILEEAGLPPGVIQFLPGNAGKVASPILGNSNLAGIHFTGSTGVFQGMWKTIGDNIAKYRSYPRIVGETGGKDFVMVHPSAEVDVITTALIRGAFEYQGQKCSAASRAYIPSSKWPQVKDKLVETLRTIKMGDVTDFSCFMTAVIDEKAYDRIVGYIEGAKASGDTQLIAGGTYKKDPGFFIAPTVLETTNPRAVTMVEEIFGPVLTVYVYDDAKFEETLHLCDQTSPYALTGSILSQDRAAVELAGRILNQSAGNFYINNKPTGAVVGQQPFGGARASGTNDKAGSIINLLRWTSVRTISETFVPPVDYRYPFLG